MGDIMNKNIFCSILLTAMTSAASAQTITVNGSGYCSNSDSYFPADCAQTKAYNRAMNVCLSNGGNPISISYTGGCSRWGEMQYGFTTDCSYAAHLRCEF